MENGQNLDFQIFRVNQNFDSIVTPLLSMSMRENVNKRTLKNYFSKKISISSFFGGESYRKTNGKLSHQVKPAWRSLWWSFGAIRVGIP